MKFLKIKLGLFSLLAIFAVSVFLTSCEQESIKLIQASMDLSKQEIPEEVELYANDEADNSLIPQGVEIPELDEETILKLKTDENIKSRGCLPYNGPSYPPPKKWILNKTISLQNKPSRYEKIYKNCVDIDYNFSF